MRSTNQKGFVAIMGVFLVIVLIASVAFFMYQKNNSVSNKTENTAQVTDPESLPTLSQGTDDKTIQMELDATDLGEASLESDLKSLDTEASAL